jgi:sulfatase modifying factor 1
MRRLEAICACALSLACTADEAPPRAQWQISLGTDAPIPQLGDRLIVEVLDDEGAICETCRRQIPADDPGAWPLSFGVVASPRGTRVRAVLFRGDHAGIDGYPEGGHVEVMGRLPPADEGIVAVSLVLSTDCFGIPSVPSIDQTCVAGLVTSTPLLGDAALPSPGSWPGGAEVACVGEIRPEMVCVPGGAFVLGGVAAFDDRTVPERLVVMPPFALDRAEVTVGEVKALRAAGAIDFLPIERDPTLNTLENACTFVSESAEHDDWPVNCVDHTQAAAICTALEKRLPSEAEWEWAAGNRAAETSYPWGDDADACARAVVARGRTELEFDGSFETEACRTKFEPSLPWGPTPEGGSGDVTVLGVRNLGGNVAEWTEGAFAFYDAACWEGVGFVTSDPRCRAPLPSTVRTVRGGGWNNRAYQARVVERDGVAPNVWGPGIGLRCALGASP